MLFFDVIKAPEVLQSTAVASRFLSALTLPPPSCVEQLLMDTAEATSLSLLTDLFASVPLTLWRVAGCRGFVLLPVDEPARLPGATFVEEYEASSLVCRGVLSLVFKMICIQIGKGLPAVGDVAQPPQLDGSDPKDDVANDEQSVPRDGCSRSEARGPWRTPAEALVSICAASCSDGCEEVRLSFGPRLISIFCEQDDALVDMLLTNLHIYHGVRDEVMAGANRRFLPIANKPLQSCPIAIPPVSSDRDPSYVMDFYPIDALAERYPLQLRGASVMYVVCSANSYDSLRWLMSDFSTIESKEGQFIGILRLKPLLSFCRKSHFSRCFEVRSHTNPLKQRVRIGQSFPPQSAYSRIYFLPGT